MATNPSAFKEYLIWSNAHSVANVFMWTAIIGGIVTSSKRMFAACLGSALVSYSARRYCSYHIEYAKHNLETCCEQSLAILGGSIDDRDL